MFAHLHAHPVDHDHHKAALAVAAAGAAVALALGAARVLQSNDHRAPATLTEQISPQPTAPVPTTVPAIPPPVLPGVAGEDGVEEPTATTAPVPETVPAPTVTDAVPAPEVTFVIPEYVGYAIVRVTLVDEAVGVEVATQPIVDGSTRFENLRGGSYHLTIYAETGITEINGAAISAAQAEKTDPFVVPQGRTLVVTTGP
jgi:hypothetical protein